jgi:ribosomal protein L14
MKKMLLKESWVYISDNTNVRWVKIFHLYKGFNRKKTKPGFFVKGSSRIVEPPRLEYKGFKYKYSLKGDIVKLWLVRALFISSNLDTSNIKFNQNSGIVISKKQNIKSKFINGPCSSNIKFKKLHTVFKLVI